MLKIELENKMRCGQKPFVCVSFSIILTVLSFNHSVFAENAKEEWIYSSKETKDGARLAFALGAGETEEQNLSAEEKNDLRHLKTVFVGNHGKGAKSDHGRNRAGGNGVFEFEREKVVAVLWSLWATPEELSKRCGDCG